MLSLPLRGQVWTTIKTEFHWQPSGKQPSHRPRGTGHLQASTGVCAHMRPHTQMHVVTHTHAHTHTHTHHSIVTSMLPVPVGWGETNKLRSGAAVELEARGTLGNEL